MDLIFLEEAWEDYLNWQRHDKNSLNRLNALIKDTQCSPFSGIGKPEPLKFDMGGCWSRRINGEHHLVYKVENDKLIILQCMYHY